MKKFLVLFFFPFLFSFHLALAAPGDIEGWAWGGNEMPDTNGALSPNNGVIDGDENGIGWISMSSKDCDTDGNGLIDNANCGIIGLPIATYAVNIPATDGNLSGYAWSEHYGWISFNPSDVTGCPSGTCAARRVGDMILGWARILSIRDAGVNAGGWQGWISLSGIGYGLQISNMNKMGTVPTYAYSDELGWIDFSLAGYGADYRICPSSLTITEGMTGSLRAYYNANGVVDCLNLTGATEVTSSVTWSSSTPGVATVGASTGLVMGVTVGNSIITTTNYSGKTAPSVSVNVICASNYATLCAAASPAECPTAMIAITDRCGTTTNTCAGTRNCDFNWKEIAP